MVILSQQALAFAVVLFAVVNIRLSIRVQSENDCLTLLVLNAHLNQRKRLNIVLLHERRD
jgi:hypothetical protein